MIYELKKYIPHTDKEKALKARFANTTLPIFARLGIRVLYCFENPEEPSALYYMTVFDTPQQRDAAWKAFGADTEWKRAKASSEVDGPLLGSQSTVELHPASFSPLMPGRILSSA